MLKSAAIVATLLLAVSAQAQFGIHPKPCDDKTFKAPAKCVVPTGKWVDAVDCLKALVAEHPDIFTGAVMGYQSDLALPGNNNGMPVIEAAGAEGTGFTRTSVVSLASCTKPLTYVALAKLIQDHQASADCIPVDGGQIPRCVFPNGYETRLTRAINTLDRRNGTDVARWWNSPHPDDAVRQAAWREKLTIRHLAQMTGGFPNMTFTGYRFCIDGVCPPSPRPQDEIDCQVRNGQVEDARCGYAYRYVQYLERRGGPDRPCPLSCKPRGDRPRIFDFTNYYDGDVYAEGRMNRRFERRYSFEPGTYGECVYIENGNTRKWVDGREATETDIAKFYLGMPLQREPGEAYDYSQPPLYVVAYLIEALSGKRFDDYLKTEILEPLGMVDTMFRIAPGTPRFSRVVDIKRLPRSRNYVLPDVAPGLDPTAPLGADRNWDESRTGWEDRWPEGGAYSTAGDLLRFLRFIGTGKAGDKVILNEQSLDLVANKAGPTGPRTYAFRATPNRPLILANGYFLTYLQRDKSKCQNITVLMQGLLESPETQVEPVPMCDIQYGDPVVLRDSLVRMLESLPAGCVQASPSEP